MDQIDLIMTALVTGAAAGTTATAEQALKDSYAGLKSKVGDLLRNRGADRRVLEALEAGDVQARRQIQVELEAAPLDASVVEAAQKVHAQLKGAWGTPKYQAWVHDSQGVVIGDGAHVTMSFDTHEGSQ